MTKKKLATKLAPTVIPQHGNGRLLPGGQPGHVGGGGRPRDELRQWIVELFNNDQSREQIQRILANADHPAFSSVFGKLLPYVLGPVKESVQDDGSGVLLVMDL